MRTWERHLASRKISYIAYTLIGLFVTLVVIKSIFTVLSNLSQLSDANRTQQIGVTLQRAPCATQGTMDDMVRCLLEGMPQKGALTGRMLTPNEKQTDEWKMLVGEMWKLSHSTATTMSSYSGRVESWNAQEAQQLCEQLNDRLSALLNEYRIEWLQWSDSAHGYCGIMQRNLTLGWPTLIVKTKMVDTWESYDRLLASDNAYLDVHLQIAHPITDGKVAQQGTSVLRESNVTKSLMIGGSTRSASEINSTCQPTNYETDVAHNTNNLFQHATIAIRYLYAELQKYDKLLCVQLHGMADTSCSNITVFMSNGYVDLPDQSAKPNQNLVLLRESILGLESKWNVTTPYINPCRLNGKSNVQGRVLNYNPEKPLNLSTVCSTQSQTVTGAFLHIEQKWQSVTRPELWSKALDLAFSKGMASSVSSAFNINYGLGILMTVIVLLFTNSAEFV